MKTIKVTQLQTLKVTTKFTYELLKFSIMKTIKITSYLHIQINRYENNLLSIYNSLVLI